KLLAVEDDRGASGRGAQEELPLPGRTHGAHTDAVRWVEIDVLCHYSDCRPSGRRPAGAAPRVRGESPPKMKLPGGSGGCPPRESNIGGNPGVSPGRQPGRPSRI